MSISRVGAAGKLKIVHVFRAPLGGLFRHVVDLASEQAARGHEVGMFFDSGGRCGRVDQTLAQVPGGLRLGVRTAPIHRNPGPSDLLAFVRLCAWLGEVEPDVVHGHGSKGGVLARLTRAAGRAPAAARAYTPHGGSFNYRPLSAAHRVYMAIERLLVPLTDAFLFESGYIESLFDIHVGAKTKSRRVVFNGLRAAEFESVAPNLDAAELVYVGELRAAKGVDTLIEAVALLNKTRERGPRLVLVGSGPDDAALIEQARRLGVADNLSFPGPMPIRRAMALGRVLVVPSRAESLPYVVLEAAAARVPMVATDVGGIPEIYGPFKARLGPSGDSADLSRRLAAMLDQAPLQRENEVADLSRFVAETFRIETMADAVVSAYREALGSRRRPSVADAPTSLQPRPEG
jgi:glycosyltransferase involved in cell wall biosynthesis